MNFYKQLNGLRFLFVFFVLLQHWGPQVIYDKTHLGGIGVNLFFVLSGFLIGEILLKENQSSDNKVKSIKKFFIRRSLRIFPIYYIVIIVYGLLFTTGGMLLWNATYTTNILECIRPEDVAEGFGHLWSLCVEEQFYLFFPWIVFFVRKEAIFKIIVSGIVLAVFARAALTIFDVINAYYICSRFTLMCVDCLFAGVLLAHYKTFSKERLEQFFSNKVLIFSFIVVCFLLLIAIQSSGNELLESTFFRFVSAIMGVLVIGYSVIKGYTGGIKKFLENRWVAEMGKISYGIYLYHTFVEVQYYKHAANNPLKSFFTDLNTPIISNRYILDFISLFIITMVVALVSYYTLEITFLKLKERYS